MRHKVDDGNGEGEDDLRVEQHRHKNLEGGKEGLERTQSLLIFGLVSRKMNANAVANPAHSAASPTPNLTSAEIGVKFPNAFARRNRGNESISIVR